MAQATCLKHGGQPYRFFSVLLRMGLACAFPVTGEAVVSYTAFPPLPADAGGLFLLRYPEGFPCRTLSGILPCEARTFLSRPLSVLTAAAACPAHRIIAFPALSCYRKYRFRSIFPVPGPFWYNHGSLSFCFLQLLQLFYRNRRDAAVSCRADGRDIRGAVHETGNIT